MRLRMLSGLPIAVRQYVRDISWQVLRWSMITGMLGGLIGWAIGEPFNGPNQDESLILAYRDDIVYFAAISIAIGAALGGLPGVLNRSRYQFVRGSCIGALVGGLLGGVGALPAQYLFNLLGDGTLARGIAWGIVGIAVGLCPGAATRDRRRALRGILGGAVGGFVAGLLFDLVYFLLPHGATDTGTASRFVADIVVGLSIGLAVALIESVAKAAWLVVTSGRREGTQLILSKDVNTIGRDDRDDVLLWGDPLLASTHARIVRRHGHYLLENVTVEGSTSINGVEVRGPGALRDDDEITVGTTRLRFHIRDSIGGSQIAPTLAPSSDAIGGKGLVEARPQAAMADPVRIGLSLRQDTSSKVAAINAVRPELTLTVQPSFCLMEVATTGRVYRLKPGSTIRVGRGQDNDVIIDDATVSSRHAELRNEHGQWVVHDLGSTNGTYVYDGGTGLDRRVVTSTLKDGSTIQFGHVALRLAQQPVESKRR